MEFIIISSNKIIKKKLMTMLKDIYFNISDDLLDFSINMPESITEFIDICIKGLKTIVIVDISLGKILGYDWDEIISLFSAKYKNVFFTVISNNDEDARIILKKCTSVIYFINISKESLEDEILKMIDIIIDTDKEVIRYLFIENNNGFYEKIILKDIFFIETIKGTHKCNVTHKNGEGVIRGSISKISARLDEKFILCRSSTIANFDNVIKVDFKNNLLYFNQGCSCSFSRSNKKRIKEIIKTK